MAALKLCATCLIKKPRADFYTHPRASDGLLGRCKDCHRAAMILNRRAKLEACREYDRQRAGDPRRVAARRLYSKTEAYRASHAKACAAYSHRHPERKSAQKKVNNAVRDGRLTTQPCEVCGSATAQAHHDDYARPLDVRWLCVPHHAAHHKDLRAIARRDRGADAAHAA